MHSNDCFVNTNGNSKMFVVEVFWKSMFLLIKSFGRRVAGMYKPHILFMDFPRKSFFLQLETLHFSWNIIVNTT